MPAQGSPGDITFSTFIDSDSTLAAEADFPADAPAGSGKPGPRVRVNLAYAGSPNTDLTKLRNMVHEIGHTLGYRHTNWQGNEPVSAYGANLIPGTPSTDPASVMNGGTAGVSWAGFSTYDNVATRTLYPGTCLAANMSGHYQVQPYVTCTWSANPTGGTPPYLYSWMGTALTSSRTFLYSNPGSDFVMRLVVVDAIGRRDSVSQSVRVYQYGPPCA
ncbi:MAG: hypothetical protein IRY91_00130 [Gemmatimonadaceae bacterium]|nr:hypothetical protein [Gemmatimonadaceae bacterium]